MMVNGAVLAMTNSVEIIIYGRFAKHYNIPLLLQLLQNENQDHQQQTPKTNGLFGYNSIKYPLPNAG